jgi:hypothetical protein
MNASSVRSTSSYSGARLPEAPRASGTPHSGDRSRQGPICRWTCSVRCGGNTSIQKTTAVTSGRYVTSLGCDAMDGRGARRRRVSEGE